MLGAAAVPREVAAAHARAAPAIPAAPWQWESIRGLLDPGLPPLSAEQQRIAEGAAATARATATAIIAARDASAADSTIATPPAAVWEMDTVDSDGELKLASEVERKAAKAAAKAWVKAEREAKGRKTAKEKVATGAEGKRASLPTETTTPRRVSG